MVLSDRDIREELRKGRIAVQPIDDSAIQPASVDLRLGRKLRVFQRHHFGVIDPRQEMPHLTELVEMDEVAPFVLHPGEFALGMTLEEVHLPDDVVGRLDGKSSLGRLGLVVHSTAGFVDPGWKGHLTLELSNLANLPINLYYGMKVSQLSFIRLSSPAQRPYGSRGIGSKYQGQAEPTPSRYFENYGRPPVRTRRKRQDVPETAEPLRAWLRGSSFQGSVSGFAVALDIKLKTVENWVYGRTRPSRRFWARLHRLTGLPQFRDLDLVLVEP